MMMTIIVYCVGGGGGGGMVMEEYKKYSTRSTSDDDCWTAATPEVHALHRIILILHCNAIVSSSASREYLYLEK